jgi:hypothetical protein
VHSITELADLARMQLNQLPGQPSGQVPGNPGAPQQGWAAEPVAGPVGGSGMPGRSQVPMPGAWPRRGPGIDAGDSIGDSIGDAVAGAALGAVAGFLGRAVSRKVMKTVNDRVLPTIAASKGDVLRDQVAIAEKYPEICACLTDHAVFLAGGSRVLPMPNLGTLTLPQADAMVAQLRQG